MIFFQLEEYNMTGEQLADWYFSLPLFGQVLIVLSIIAILALIFAIIFYIILGLGYVVYYLLKGLYYLLKEVGHLLLRLSRAIYRMMFDQGTHQPDHLHQQKIQSPTEVHSTLIKKQKNLNAPPLELIDSQIKFCNECGAKFTLKMKEFLNSRGLVYCEYCGKGFEIQKTEMEA